MKNKLLKFAILYIGIVYILIAGIPFVFHLITSQEAETGAGVSRKIPPAFVATIEQINGNNKISEPLSDNFRIFDTATKKTSTVEEKKFLFSTLACEMSPEVPMEALKAQTVAAYSYYSTLRSESSDKEYDFTWNSEKSLTYCPKKELMEKWGDNAASYEEKLNSVIDDVYGEILTYDNKVAMASYFPTSNGQTESAENILGEAYPYLISVASPYDMLANGYRSTVTLTPAAVKKIMETTWSSGKYNFELPYEEWFTEAEYTIGGTVFSINICTFSITGVEARDVFSLNSPSFSVEYDGENFIFSVRGYGHGVGMSQTGAIYMAANDADYMQILNWYYPGTQLQKSK